MISSDGIGNVNVGTGKRNPIIQKLLSEIEDTLVSLDERINILHNNLEYISLPRPTDVIETKPVSVSPIMADRLSKILDSIKIARNRIAIMAEELEI